MRSSIARRVTAAKREMEGADQPPVVTLAAPLPPATLDLILTKMMRGDDPQDLVRWTSRAAERFKLGARTARSAAPSRLGICGLSCPRSEQNFIKRKSCPSILHQP